MATRTLEASVALLLCGGCGLLLDLDTESRGEDADGASIDAGTGSRAEAGTVNASDAAAEGGADAAEHDASMLCLGGSEMLALDALSFDSGGTSQLTRCNAVVVSVSGTPSMGTPEVVVATDSEADYLVIALAAVGGGSASLLLEFDRPVEGLSFAFDWLSYNYEGVMFDERLGVRVDGSVIAPTLTDEANVVRHADELGATTPRASGVVAIERASTLQIDLRNADVQDGWGVELHSFTFTTTP